MNLAHTNQSYYHYNQQKAEIISVWLVLYDDEDIVHLYNVNFPTIKEHSCLKIKQTNNVWQQIMCKHAILGGCLTKEIIWKFVQSVSIFYAAT